MHLYLFYTRFITARIRRMREGNIFSLCVSPHLEGVPPSTLNRGGATPNFLMGGPHPSQQGVPPSFLMEGTQPSWWGEYPIQSRWGSTPILLGGGGLSPSQVPPSWPETGYPLCQHYGVGGTPILTWDGGTPPIQVRSQVRTGGYPQLEQHSVYLVRGGRYASCVPARGLSCLLIVFVIRIQL